MKKVISIIEIIAIVSVAIVAIGVMVYGMKTYNNINRYIDSRIGTSDEVRDAKVYSYEKKNEVNNWSTTMDHSAAMNAARENPNTPIHYRDDNGEMRILEYVYANGHDYYVSVPA